MDRLILSPASSTQVRSWSHNEVKLPDTISYKSFEPVENGLYCMKTFGPPKPWKCACGFYSDKVAHHQICPKCGTEVLSEEEKRDRMGHIELLIPMVHTWYYKLKPSFLSTILGISSQEVENIVYCSRFVCISVPFGSNQWQIGQLVTERIEDVRAQNPNVVFATGGIAIRELLKLINIEQVYFSLREEADFAKTVLTRQKAETITKFVGEDLDFKKARLKLDNITLDCIAILPAELRPLIPQGGQWIWSQLNDIYRAIIYRSNQLKAAINDDMPWHIVNNQIKLVQQAVDHLLLVKQRDKNKEIQALAHYLVGKKGRFRGNLVGKRADYSARSVIVAGPHLKLNQCGVPITMAMEVFKPELKWLLERDYNISQKQSKEWIKNNKPEIFPALERIAKVSPVLLNRAPTLHKLSMQAFDPVLTNNKVIELHPLVCNGFNADFDGDQMALHSPKSREAIWEAHNMMKSTKNILHPATGDIVLGFSQDLILGFYWLTSINRTINQIDRESLRRFHSPLDAIRVTNNNNLHYREPILVDMKLSGKYSKVLTTSGRLIFDAVLPSKVPSIDKSDEYQKIKLADPNIPLQGKYLFKLFDRKEAFHEGLVKGDIKTLLNRVNIFYGQDTTVEICDQLVKLGFDYATKMGASMSLSDFKPYEMESLSFQACIDKSENEINKKVEYYSMGFMTKEKLSNSRVKIWTKCTNDIKDKIESIMKSLPNSFINQATVSGARGSLSQLNMLVGMRGLLVNNRNEFITEPVKTNYLKGITYFDYYQSAPATRKGETDKSLKTPQAGYLTRRLVFSTQDMIIRDYDCNLNAGIEIDLTEESIPSARLVGRSLTHDIGPIKAGTLINPFHADIIDKLGLERVIMHSPLTCGLQEGICAKCYGTDLSTNQLALPGFAAGIISAQAVGEPSVQLTLNSKHLGGAASRSDEDVTGGLTLVIQLFELKRKDLREKLEAQGDIYQQALWLIKSISDVYAISGGVYVNPKHFETAIRGMMSRVRVIHPGDSHLMEGMIVSKTYLNKLNNKLIQQGKKDVDAEVIISGISANGVERTSKILSPAAFQFTIKVLFESVLYEVEDNFTDLMSTTMKGGLCSIGSGVAPLNKQMHDDIQSIYKPGLDDILLEPKKQRKRKSKSLELELF